MFGGQCHATFISERPGKLPPGVGIEWFEKINITTPIYHSIIMKQVLTFVFLLSMVQSWAVDRTWVGISNGIWHSAVNWSPMGIPAEGDTVRILGGQNVNITSASDTIFYLLIDGGSRLIIRDGGILNVKGQHATNTFLDYGIYLKDGNINNGFEIHITGDNAGGIYLGPDGVLDGSGEIWINNLKDFSRPGIYNQGQCVYDGPVYMTDLNYIGVWNFGEFIVMDDGLIEVSHGTSRGVQNADSLVNHGAIRLSHLGSEALYNTGQFVNSGAINIDSVGSAAVLSIDTFLNEVNALIEIDSASFNGFTLSGFFMNDGSIIATRMFEGIYSQTGGFVNTGNIELTNCKADGLEILESFGSNTGSIQINGCSRGLYVYGQVDSFSNEGNFSINDAFIGVLNYSTLENSIGSTLSIENCTLSGFRHYGTAENEGSISINLMGSAGLEIFHSTGVTQLQNLSDGHISITNCQGDPFTASLNTIFDCEGTLEVDP